MEPISILFYACVCGLLSIFAPSLWGDGAAYGGWRCRWDCRSDRLADHSGINGILGMKTLACLPLLFFAPVASHAWVADNGLIVEPGGGEFHVPYRGLTGARDFWCAAGDYVIDKLELPPDTLIFRTSSPPRRAGKGISFSLSVSNAKKPGLFVFGKQKGLTAAHARDFCNRLKVES